MNEGNSDSSFEKLSLDMVVESDNTSEIRSFDDCTSKSSDKDVQVESVNGVASIVTELDGRSDFASSLLPCVEVDMSIMVNENKKESRFDGVDLHITPLPSDDHQRSEISSFMENDYVHLSQVTENEGNVDNAYMNNESDAVDISDFVELQIDNVTTTCEKENNAPHQEDHEAVIEQLMHLQKRITNIQESIQLSSNALCVPSNWENNCLNAVKNCIGEWRSIVSFHGNNYLSHDNEEQEGSTEENVGNSERHPMHPNSEWSKTTALKIFGLLQLAMQCGPLNGSNAGYFKRCGGKVAMTAKTFLTKSVSGDVMKDLRFTKKQQIAIAKWLSAAEKAVTENKSPSKAAMKLQQKGNNTKFSSKKRIKY